LVYETIFFEFYSGLFSRIGVIYFIYLKIIITIGFSGLSENYIISAEMSSLFLEQQKITQ